MRRAALIHLLSASTAIYAAGDPSTLTRFFWRPMIPAAGGIGVVHINGQDIWYGTRGKIMFESVGEYPRPNTELSIRSVAYANNSYIAVGDSGLIWRRGFDAWTPRESGTTNALNSVIYSGGIWITVGDRSTVLYSTDQTNWRRATLQADLPAFDAYKIVFGLGRFFLFGSTGTGAQKRGFIASSADGLYWQSVTLGSVPPLLNAAASDNSIVTVGSTGTILRSMGGGNWTQSWQPDPEFTGPMPDWIGIAWGNGTFVAQTAEGFALYSTNALSWDSVGESGSQPLQKFSQRYLPVTFAPPNRFHFLMSNFPHRRELSALPAKFVGHRDGPDYSYFDGAHLNGVFAAAYTFANSWKLSIGQPPPILEEPFSLSEIDNDLVIHLPGRLSRWSENFLEESGPSFSSKKIIQGNGAYVAITRNSEIYHASNLSDWQLAHFAPGTNWNSLVFGRNRFVASGQVLDVDTEPRSSVIRSSSDGRSWKQLFSSEAIIHELAAGSETLMAVGTDNGTGVVFVSTNGVDWAVGKRFDDLPLYRVAYGRGLFLIAGFNGRPFVYVSRNGYTWKNIHCSMDNPINVIAYNGDHFVLLGPRGEVLQSPKILDDTTALSILEDQSGFNLQVRSRFTDLMIESSADLRTWQSFLHETNRPAELSYNRLPLLTNAFYRVRLPY